MCWKCHSSLSLDKKNIKMASYLGHLDHIWKLCQTGNGDHIMVGFQLGPDEAIKELVWVL